MKINRVVPGKYSEIKVEGKKIFLSVLPDRITASEMFLFVPTKKIWEFIFPFYIRTSNEAWESSKAILQLTLDSIQQVEALVEFKEALNSHTNKALRDYIKEHGEEAKDTSVDKVGIYAIKKMLDPKDLNQIEKIIHAYGKVQEEVSQKMLTDYPTMHFPESLLPYPKEKVRMALTEGIKYSDDEQMVETLKSCLAFLDGFIKDEEANKKNKELLDNLTAHKKISEFKKSSHFLEQLGIILFFSLGGNTYPSIGTWRIGILT